MLYNYPHELEEQISVKEPSAEAERHASRVSLQPPQLPEIIQLEGRYA